MQHYMQHATFYTLIATFEIEFGIIGISELILKCNKQHTTNIDPQSILLNTVMLKAQMEECSCT